MTQEFASRFVGELPGENGGVLVSAVPSRQVFEACYSRVDPTPVSAPRLIAHSREMASRLGLAEGELGHAPWLQILGGNALGTASRPFAACYGGHQFGNWAGQLGDGRALGLGELTAADGSLWELQLKGAGPTPYSRRADGRAVMRSSVREFLCSEAMAHLGVPTTRALSLVGTGEQVVRDMFYDGHPRAEPGAIVCRVAPTFVRFGNFEIFASRGDETRLKALTEFCLRHFFQQEVRDVTGHTPLELEKMGKNLAQPDAVVAMFQTVCRRTAQLMVEWMRVGFVHGVMNTDNMSILGLTIDYGPYGWLEDFDPAWTPNTTDAQGRRYRYGNQPRIAQWNLAQLGSALLPLVETPAPLERALSDYSDILHQAEVTMMAQKLGLSRLFLDVPDDASPDDLRRGQADRQLIGELVDVLQLVETDMTLFYRGLANVDISADALRGAGMDALHSAGMDALHSAGMDALRAPLEGAYYQPQGREPDQLRQIDAWLRNYVRRTLDDPQFDAMKRRQQMNAVNPKYVLRNYLAQLAIDQAEQGDGQLVMELLDVLRRPYDEQPQHERYAEKRPDWARHRAGCSMLSCSS
ncbi:MAG TPA: YdiU family protein [Polyangiaceae bacterium]|nr:YdiU family protein [Polyangiaceae bacterium]